MQKTITIYFVEFFLVWSGDFTHPELYIKVQRLFELTSTQGNGGGASGKKCREKDSYLSHTNHSRTRYASDSISLHSLQQVRDASVFLTNNSVRFINWNFMRKLQVLGFFYYHLLVYGLEVPMHTRKVFIHQPTCGYIIPKFIQSLLCREYACP